MVMSQSARTAGARFSGSGRNAKKKQIVCEVQCTDKDHIPCDPRFSVADPRLFLQAVAHPERFILEPTFLAGLSSLTLFILAGVYLWDTGD
tara:strand:- start:635 stop:907 length:273 start_codon:yes stop_codon:yes gene_type:complete